MRGESRKLLDLRQDWLVEESLRGFRVRLDKLYPDIRALRIHADATGDAIRFFQGCKSCIPTHGAACARAPSPSRRAASVRRHRRSPAVHQGVREACDSWRNGVGVATRLYPGRWLQNSHGISHRSGLRTRSNDHGCCPGQFPLAQAEALEIAVSVRGRLAMNSIARGYL
jgi:hypothetical protein